MINRREKWRYESEEPGVFGCVKDAHSIQGYCTTWVPASRTTAAPLPKLFHARQGNRITIKSFT